MAEQDIPPHPNNFTLWYHYFSSTYPDLEQTLKTLLDSNEGFDEARSASLYQKFFSVSGESATVSESARHAEATLAKIVEFLGDAGEDTHHYGETLADFSGTLAAFDEKADAGGLAAMVANVVNATRVMETHNAKLEDQLTSSAGEIKKLRQDLEDMRREALTDSLTGLANRKMFDMELRRLCAEASERSGELCLLMLDIDFFKKFNDTYGHQVGDQVLRLLAKTMNSAVSDGDVAARYGGEEFAVILPDSDLSHAAGVGETIRRRISSKEVVNRKTGTSMGKITVSVGCSMFVGGEPLGQFITRADMALYEAKGQGRNRVVSEDDMNAATVDATN